MEEHSENSISKKRFNSKLTENKTPERKLKLKYKRNDDEDYLVELDNLIEDSHPKKRRKTKDENREERILNILDNLIKNGLIKNMAEEDEDEIITDIVQNQYESLSPCEIKLIRDSIKVNEIDLNKIIKCELPQKKFIKAIQLFVARCYYDKYSEDWNRINQELKEYLKQKNKTVSPYPKTKLNYKSDLIRKVLDLDASDNIKRIIMGKVEELMSARKNGKEESIEPWLKWALNLPYNKCSVPLISGKLTSDKINLLCQKVKSKLDEDIYGLESVKNQLLIILVKRITNQKVNSSIALHGPPGVGKTSIVKSLAESLNLPYCLNQLGGLSDSSVLKGSNGVWIGSTPSIIVKNLRRMGVSDGIIFFDEIDKVGTSPNGLETQDVLLHISDPTSNTQFMDSYIDEFPHDLSRIWFIYALNDIKYLSKPLLDRLNIINIPKYTEKELREILIQKIIPKQLAEYQIKNIELTENAIDYIIRNYGTGVRKLKEVINNWIEKLHFIRTTKQSKLLNNKIKASDINRLVFDQDDIKRFVEKNKSELSLSYFL